MASLKWQRLQMALLYYGVVIGKNESFKNIFEMYDRFLQFLQINTVVFDGYS